MTETSNDLRIAACQGIILGFCVVYGSPTVNKARAAVGKGTASAEQQVLVSQLLEEVLLGIQGAK